MTTTTKLDAQALKRGVRRSLPTLPLEAIRIASPCTASWADMQGDERTRHCGQCDKQVHDLSKMSRAEAEALVSGPGPTPCIRMWVRHDGTVITQDCPVGLEKLRRHLKRVGAIFGALLGWVVGLTGCTRNDEPTTSTDAPQVQPAAQGGATAPVSSSMPVVDGPEDSTCVKEPEVGGSPAPEVLMGKPSEPRVMMGAPPPPPRND